MVDGLPLIPGLGLVGVLLLFVLGVFRMVFTGALVPRATHQEVLNDRDNWRKAHTVSEAARGELAGQVDELLEHARTSDAFIRAVASPPPRPEDRAP